MSDLYRRFVVRIVPKTKKNSQEIRVRRDGSRFVSPSGDYQRWERTVADVLALLNRGAAPIQDPINVRVIFYMPTARRVDLTNLLEAADDALVKAGVLKDDCASILAGHDGSRVLIDRMKPRLDIMITPAEEWQIFREVENNANSGSV